jgi:Ni/Co efflux regulator RcnB
MNFKQLLLTAVAAAVLSSTGAGMAVAAPHDRGGHSDRDRGGDRHDGDRRGDRRDGYRHDGNRGHDRYWRQEYRHGYVDRDRIFFGLRQHHYGRFIGDPYWFNGRYVVRTYDRFGHVVIVEVDPYTGDVIGVIRF